MLWSVRCNVSGTGIEPAALLLLAPWSNQLSYPDHKPLILLYVISKPLAQHSVVPTGVMKEPPLQESLEPAPVDTPAKEQRYMSGQYFFEYLVVVSLKKSKEGAYEPQITYQFPKVSPLISINAACLPKGKRKKNVGKKWKAQGKSLNSQREVGEKNSGRPSARKIIKIFLIPGFIPLDILTFQRHMTSSCKGRALCQRDVIGLYLNLSLRDSSLPISSPPPQLYWRRRSKVSPLGPSCVLRQGERNWIKINWERAQVTSLWQIYWSFSPFLCCPLFPSLPLLISLSLALSHSLSFSSSWECIVVERLCGGLCPYIFVFSMVDG